VSDGTAPYAAQQHTLWSLLDDAVARWPDEPMLVSRQGDRCTFREFRSRAERMAAGFAAAGVRAGDVVSWILPTWVDTVVLAAALSRLGTVQNPIVAIYRAREVGFCVSQTNARLLITPGIFAGFDYAAMGAQVAADIGGCAHLVVEPGGFPDAEPGGLAAPVLPDDRETRWICYTSGTTADPKGARHSDFTLGAYPAAMAERHGVTAGDRYSLVFPFPHVGGVGLLFMALHRSCTMLLDAVVDPVETVEFLARERCTHAGTGTAFFNMYLARQAARDTPLFPELKLCPAGGAPTSPAIQRRVHEELGGAGVADAWGLTEAPVLACCDRNDPMRMREQIVGRPMPGVDLRVVGVDGTLCPHGHEGELRVRAPQLMLGYQDSDLDRDAFDEDGYFRTGDLGVVSPEGFVTIAGRLKDVIIRNGENVSAKEVEDLLYATDNITDAAVFGLPDERTGESVCAVVVTADGSRMPTLESVREALSTAGLRRQALPTKLVFAEALPRNPAGKVLKRELVRRALEVP